MGSHYMRAASMDGLLKDFEVLMLPLLRIDSSESEGKASLDRHLDHMQDSQVGSHYMRGASMDTVAQGGVAAGLRPRVRDLRVPGWPAECCGEQGGGAARWRPRVRDCRHQ